MVLHRLAKQRHLTTMCACRDEATRTRHQGEDTQPPTLVAAEAPGLSMALTNAHECSDSGRRVSVRPRMKNRVMADSYLRHFMTTSRVISRPLY